MISSSRAARYPRFEISSIEMSSTEMSSTEVSRTAPHAASFRRTASVLALGVAFGASLPLFAAKPAAKPAAASATQTAAAPAARVIGTVESISGNSLTLKSDDGKSSTVAVAEGARILQIAPGSTSLKSAEVIALTDIAVGDRILVTGQAAAAAPAPFQASRIILMKSIDIAKKHAAEAQEWEKHGTGGIVSAVDPATGTVTITSRGKKIAVQTTASTIFRRYAGDSVKYEDARPSVLAAIQPGDQMRVRGQRSDDGMTIQAAEIVSGSFLNLAGTIATLDASAGTLTLKDLATKKTYTVAVTANSNLRYLPPEDARKFAALERGAGGSGAPGAAGGSGSSASHGGGATSPSGTSAAAAGHAHSSSEAAAQPPAASPSANPTPGAAPAMSLSQMLPQLPTATLADLRPGDALMIVASQPSPGSSSLTAVTVLAGVEPILTATPTGRSGPSLSPWNVSGAPDDGGGM